MFSKSSKQPSAASPTVATGARHTPFSIIGGDVTITGNVEASVDLHIDGKVEGDIACAALVQGAESRIAGHVKAKSARIGGLVEGSINAEELVVEATARITGDVSYERITIATGGQIDGRMTHIGQTAELKLIKSEVG
ncbi:MAG: polymer-forming cytoskeletal protein [Alphaproteobacteria bacterium]|jgi:Integral membrane protein CcmA involved in cell shape determination|nr:polymer-forming cytoskeletal protein [Alphaproteobacteria bacterium]MBU0793741.1 polymer-forming cytoskeletal protein [Alphaproteobacteria bacterium]MBU0876465.1 polymer-forming cytoskeletal protein [Alphaproteobacteria bacterium]MBU1769484.1 polymer-forming cytoskeletal protein [Alphaproteobacteria bacterium]